MKKTNNQIQNIDKVDEILNNLNAIKSFSLQKNKANHEVLSPINKIQKPNELNIVKKVSHSQNIDQNQEENDWNNINIGINNKAFTIKKTYALRALNNLDNSYQLKAYFQGNKILIKCNNSVNSFLLQNIFGIPTKEELADFGEEDYTIIIADIPKYNSNTFENNYFNGSIDIDILTKEIVILGDQFLWEIKIELFLVMNEILIGK